MDTTTETRLRRAARFATYDDEATGLGRVAPDRSRWATPADVRAFRRSVVLADRYRQEIRACLEVVAIPRDRGTVT